MISWEGLGVGVTTGRAYFELLGLVRVAGTQTALKALGERRDSKSVCARGMPRKASSCDTKTTQKI